MQLLLSLLIVSTLFLGWSIDNYMCDKKYTSKQIWKRCTCAFVVVFIVTAIYDTNCSTNVSGSLMQKTGKAPF